MEVSICSSRNMIPMHLIIVILDVVSWTRNLLMKGDYFAQNHDVVQPGPIAPFYPRYGHTLDPYDIDKDGGDDIMILTGGYAPNTINDVWVTEDSITWL